ncbi:hypothetical protein Sango_0013900 [Sesamum angolense]|uniref:DUF4283 domain-containing protein n=1 Tax=Sesamum angolense TaxID=2727404 RepID=A0AAE1XDI0_9LAMI|nr:hypothetical protein Sango_0013900 [Sesamum angolense]
MEELNSLKERWQEKFQSPIESKSAKLKPVAGRVVTPLRNINIGLAVPTESSPESEKFADGKGTAQPERDFVAPTQLNSDQEMSSNFGFDSQRHPEIFIGNVKLQANPVDNIASAFLQSSRKTLHFVPPSKEKGEIIIRPSPAIIEKGSQRWQSTTFKNRAAMEDIIEEAEGLSTVASGVGIPLYTDKITKSCSRLDFARVCVMLDYNSTLPKHLVVMHPVRQEGQETPLKIDVEYEWLPQRCKTCCTLGHTAQACLENKKIEHVQSVKVFVKKQPITNTTATSGLADDMLKGGAMPEKSATPLAEPPQPILADKNKFHTKGKDIPGSRWNMIKVAAWNVRGLNGTDHQRAVEHLEDSLAADADEPWLVLGDFNAVIDDSEVCGHAADTSASMNEFRQCILDSGLIHFHLLAARSLGIIAVQGVAAFGNA